MEEGATDKEYLYNASAQNMTSQGEHHLSRGTPLLKVALTSQIEYHLSRWTYDQSYLWVDGHYIELLTGRRMAKVAYGWTMTTLSHLRVDV